MILHQARAVLINAGQANAATVSFTHIAGWSTCNIVFHFSICLSKNELILACKHRKLRNSFNLCHYTAKMSVLSLT